MANSRNGSKDWERILIGSDIHGVFYDEKAFNIFCQIAASHPWDRCILNGDTLDMPTISEHSKKIELFSPEILEDDFYGLDHELAHTETKIIAPLRKALGKKPDLMLRIGNHEFRLIRPNRANSAAVSEILAVQNKRKAQRLEDLLHLNKYNAWLSYNAQDRLYGSFTIIHGDKLSQSAPKGNLLKYGSGTSGHSHRGNSFVQVLMGGIQGWWESGCLRQLKNVEYLPFGVLPDWVHAFVTLYINKKNGHFFCKSHFIIDYECEFEGQLYRA